jgi:hypothetical protein
LNSLSSSKTLDSRADANNLRRLAFVSTALLLFLATAAPSAFTQTAGRKLIVTAAGARLRDGPETAAAEAGRLQLGAVVDELERSAEKSKVGSAEAFWHLVSAPGGARGWVFGGLVAPFDPARRDAVYLKLAGDRLANTSATFADLSELVRFLERTVHEVKRRDALAELELARLSALARALASIPFEQLHSQPYKTWTDEREKEIVYSEPAGQWYVRAELLWQLQRKYTDLPIAERVAWDAAQTPLPGECEGYLPCYIYKETETNGRYLKLYPRGAHADAALSNIEEFLGHVTEDLRGSSPVFEVPRDDRANFRQSVAALRAQIAPAASPKKARVLGQLDEIARHFR